MFYESKNSLHPDLLKTETGVDFHFPPHLHSSFELIAVTEGVMTVTLDKKQYSLIPGEALLIFPNQVHSLSTPEHSRHFLCIFSPQLVQAYGKTYLAKVPKSNLFRPDPFYLRELTELHEEDSLLKIKGLLYLLCAEFDRTAVYLEQSAGAEDLLIRIFRFVEQRYNRDCALTDLAREVSYHPVYLSKYFKQCTGQTFTNYVKQYRINEACHILQNTDKTVLQAAYECGFDSLRSFNRNFIKFMGMTPGQYRRHEPAAENGSGE